MPTRSKSEKTNPRKKGINSVPNTVDLWALSVFERFAQKSPVVYPIFLAVLENKKLNSEQEKTLIESMGAFYKHPMSVAVRGLTIYKGTTLNGRIDRCPDQYLAAFLQMALPPNKYTFTLNFGRKESDNALCSAAGFTEATRKALNQALMKRLGIVPEHWFFVEVGTVGASLNKPDGTFHLHGMISLPQHVPVTWVKEAMESISTFAGKKTHFGRPEGSFQSKVKPYAMAAAGAKIPGVNRSAAYKRKKVDEETYQSLCRRFRYQTICLTKEGIPNLEYREDYTWSIYSTKDVDFTKSKWSSRTGMKIGRCRSVSHQDLNTRAKGYHQLFKQLLDAKP